MVTMKRGIQVGNLFGIPFFLDPSWLFVAALLTLSNTVTFAAGTGLVQSILLGVLSVVIIFGSVLAHELGHSLIAQRFGIEVKSISLFLLGGMAAFDKEPAKPWQSFVIAAAGPMVSLGLYLLAVLGLGYVPTNSFAGILLSLLLSMNLALALFNLLPGLPLDGGQMLKAVVWGVTKKFETGVKVAAFTGQLLGWGLMGLGGYAVFVGNYSGLWLAVLGWFIQSTARLNVQAQQLNQRLSDLTVGDSLKLSGSVAANLPFSTYQEEYVKGDMTAQHLVLWQDEVIGIISATDGSDLPTNLWGYNQVRQLMTPMDTQLPSIPESTPLVQVVERFNENPKLLVRSLEGKIIGVISPEMVRRALAA